MAAWQQQHGPGEHDVDEPLPLLERLLEEGHDDAHAGVVDEHVDTAEGVHGRLGHACHVVGLGDVGADGDGPAAGGLDLVGHGLGVLGIEVGHGGPGALRGELQGDRAPQTRLRHR